MISKKQMRHIYNEVAEINACISSNKMLMDMNASEQKEVTMEDLRFICKNDHKAYEHMNGLMKYMHVVMQWDD